MRIASVIDISLVDVPGIPVTVIFTGGCNFDCPYCQNASLIPPSSGEETSPSSLIEQFQGYLSDGFCITGGEPTIQVDLPDFLKLLKDELGGHINLNTQGSVPTVLERSLTYLDSVWFDIKASPSRYEAVCRVGYDPWPYVRKSLDLVLNSSAEFWPRTTMVGGLMSDNDLLSILSLLERLGFDGRYTIQNFVRSKGVRPNESSELYAISKEKTQQIVEDANPSFEVVFEWR